MVSKRVVHLRAKDGYIPSKNKLNDRAQRANEIFEKFSSRIPESDRKKMISFSVKLLRDCEKEDYFSGRNPYVSGVAVFVFACRRFSPNCKCPVTYQDIKDKCGHFATGQSFQDMLNYFSKMFP